ncbi:MAG TPA: hypothetical protein VJJ52_07735 [Candidatus Nanoarchaeia archaeon]|nr:hypothetical protein [Candidatus Nanoarchaeia archaeon]
MTRLVLLVVVFLVSGCMIQSNESGQSSVKNLEQCNQNNECPEEYFCYNPSECGLGPNGPVPCSLKDDACHKSCKSDDDCPKESPRCLSAPWSDTVMAEESAKYHLCFK